MAFATALAASVFVSAPAPSFAQAAQTTITALASQVGAGDFAGARSTIADLLDSGVTAIKVGDETVALADLLAMIKAAESGGLNPNQLAAYFDALAANSAQAFYVRPPGQGDYPNGYDHTEPTVPATITEIVS